MHPGQTRIPKGIAEASDLPVCMGYRPVIIALRVGEQIGST